MKTLIAALRSDKYKQTTGRLRDGDCFCVLGVACDLADPTKWELHFYGWFYEDASGSTSDWVRKHFGISPKLWKDLVFLNDVQRLTFNEIADYIEAHYHE